jgi:hypothetical protein
VTHQVEDGENQVGDQNEKRNKVELRIDPPVVLEILLKRLTHARP